MASCKCLTIGVYYTIVREMNMPAEKTKPNLFISVVSHNDEKEIMEGLKPHLLQTDEVRFIVRDNQESIVLQKYCEQHDVIYCRNTRLHGYGSNHNLNFRYLALNRLIDPRDVFIVINPDVVIEKEALTELYTLIEHESIQVAAPNLYRDSRYSVYEGSIRSFPRPWDFISSLLWHSSKTNLPLKQRNIRQHVDWASGAFLVFRAHVYSALGGFDTRYFMYCEDIDICWRSEKLLNQRVEYLPQVKAIHKGARRSLGKSLKHFIWHGISASRFSMTWLLHKSSFSSRRRADQAKVIPVGNWQNPKAKISVSLMKY